jgi:dTDP-4-amino-4,6-dideoxy-D-galactose acyltransferase
LTSSPQEPCELLLWDSKFFGLNIARVTHDQLTPDRCIQIDQWCADHRIRCLYFLSRADDDATVGLSEKFGYHLVDVRLTLEQRPTPRESWLPKFPIRSPHASDLPRLKQIARASHLDTRFFFDPNFSRERAAALYETWIEASLDGFADRVFVAENNGDVAGYVTCRLSEDRRDGSIGLIAVDERYQGLGIGPNLVRTALDWLQEQHVHRMTVVTQGRNVAAQRLYGRCGFITRKFELYYHRWFPSLAEATSSSS